MLDALSSVRTRVYMIASTLMLATLLLLANDASALTYYGIDDGYGYGDVTANGEAFDPWANTAAHPNPALLNTWQTVCGPAACVDVWVNDTCACGDFDVTKGVALQIGLI